MSKALGFVIFVFIILVAGTVLVNAAAQLVSSSHASFAAAMPLSISNTETINLVNSNASYTGLPIIKASLFTKDGSGTSYVTQGYGRTPYSYLYPDNWHDGVDIAAAYGTPIYSPNDGTVIAVGNQDDYCYHRAFGKYIAVRDPMNNLILWYAHLGTQMVSSGQAITRGTELGTVGATGLETGTHLHFSIFEANGFSMQSRDGCGPEPTGQDLNPLNYLGSVYN
jgi:murein DD-endopeptidase MepM/ murein hydrolase activator NlpD